MSSLSSQLITGVLSACEKGPWSCALQYLEVISKDCEAHTAAIAGGESLPIRYRTDTSLSIFILFFYFASRHDCNLPGGSALSRAACHPCTRFLLR
jgi:hypothetical protein